MVPEVGLCASRAVGLRSAQRLWRSGAPRPLQKPHRGFCDTGLRVPDRKTKTAPLGRPLFWCRKWDSALRVRSACAPRSACAAAALPGPYKSPTGAFAIRGFESLIAKQKPPRGDGSLFWCRKWDSNPHGGLAQRILSPPRLPIPSFRPAAISARSAHSVYLNIPARELQARRSVFHYFSPWRLCAILINKRVLRHQGRALYGDGSFAF